MTFRWVVPFCTRDGGSQASVLCYLMFGFMLCQVVLCCGVVRFNSHNVEVGGGGAFSTFVLGACVHMSIAHRCTKFMLFAHLMHFTGLGAFFS